MNSKILFISTYNELSNIAEEVSEELDIPITIHEGGMLEGGHIYAKNRENDFDVIISQSGSAAIIKKMVRIPVIEIDVSMADILIALLEAKKYGSKIGFVSYNDTRLNDLTKLKEIINIEYKLYPYSDSEELRIRLDEVIGDNNMTVIGMGSCIRKIIHNDKITSIHVKSSRNSIEQAIRSADNIVQLAKREKEKNERLNAVIDNVNQGIIAIDRDGAILTVNTIAENILGIESANTIGTRINDNVELMKYEGILNLLNEKKHRSERLIKVKENKIVASCIPIIVEEEVSGMVLTFQEVSKLQKLEQQVRNKLYKKGLVAKYFFGDIAGDSMEISKTIEKAKKFGKATTSVLIEGETGTGKELFAQSMHNVSNRYEGPFVAINCSALPENLLESELFGYEDGAFTGAKKGGKPGLFELAHGGTIFLDEIGEVPLSVQSKLLRVLQEKEVMKIGGEYIKKVDINVIAATNKDLIELINEGKFREDLYFRLNILNLKIPPLRNRKEDIPVLVSRFIDSINVKYDNIIEKIEPKAMEILKTYEWPGNIRELYNFSEKICILAEKSIVTKKFMKGLLNDHIPDKNINIKNRKIDEDSIIVKTGDLKEMELQLIEAVSKEVHGDKNLLADRLGISRTTLWKRLKEIE